MANVLHNLTFEGNIAMDGNGGALYLDNIGSKLNIVNSKFKNNEAYFSGGAIFGLKVNGMVFSDLIIVNNSAI